MNLQSSPRLLAVAPVEAEEGERVARIRVLVRHRKYRLASSEAGL